MTGIREPIEPTPRGTRSPALPAADLTVGRELVLSRLEQLVLEQDADLDGMDGIEWAVGDAPLGEGWDNLMWPVGTVPVGTVPVGTGREETERLVVPTATATAERVQLVLRVARRAVAVPLLDRERTVLRHLGHHRGDLTMGIPRMLGSAEGAILMPWLPGLSAAQLAGADDRADIALHLARMLAELHSLPVPDIERSGVRGVPLASRSDAFAADLERAGLPSSLREAALGLWERGLQAERWSGRGVLIHGDPHPGNVVITPDSEPILIDWGDATVGDPASDLGALLLHDPRPRVLAEHRRRAAGRRSVPSAEPLTDGPLMELSEGSWDALALRGWAWAARMAVAMLTAYPASHPSGRAAERLLRRAS